jgi:hypothetical protein
MKAIEKICLLEYLQSLDVINILKLKIKRKKWN